MSFVMLYKTKVKEESIEKLASLRSQFNEIYEEHGVNVIGHWHKEGKQTKYYTMISYADETEYHATVQKLQADERYAKLSEELKQIRKDFESKRLIPA